MSNSYTTIPNFDDIEQLRDEAISASNSIAFGDHRMINHSIVRLKTAMDQINAKNLYFTRLAVLEEMESVLADAKDIDINVVNLAYLHREYSNNSESALEF
tara:strand:- start:175 stop:477 length:303 start_codon:yes stop_codon:yes gene_type:complete